jgi:pyrophosphatase PpaX
LADRAIVFDLDGTLIDQRALYVRANQLAAAEVLAIELSEQRVLEMLATGMPLREHMALVDEGSADRLVEAFVRHYRLEREELVRPFPGVPELLESLRASGNAIAIVTSKLRDDAVAELLVARIDSQIDVLIAFEDTEEHKPHPGPILTALESLNVGTGIGVGDLPTDVVSAKAAGLQAIGVSWGFGTPETLLSAGAECVCDTVAALAIELEYRS